VLFVLVPLFLKKILKKSERCGALSFFSAQHYIISNRIVFVNPYTLPSFCCVHILIVDVEICFRYFKKTLAFAVKITAMAGKI